MNLVPTVAEDKCRAFELEALPHLGNVQRVAVWLAGDTALADDLVQETMLRAYRAWHQYQSGTNAQAWLLRILRNTFSNHLRQQRQMPTVELGEIAGVFDEVLHLDLEGGLLDHLAYQEVLHAISGLPVRFRQALVLRGLEGLSYGEIAHVMGIPEGTVKSRIFRARRALQRQLYDWGVEVGSIEPRVA